MKEVYAEAKATERIAKNENEKGKNELQFNNEFGLYVYVSDGFSDSHMDDNVVAVIVVVDE